MITLYQLPKGWNTIPNPSQFCTKLQTYLRMAKLPFNTVETLPVLGPKGKLPYIIDDGNKIADSTFIIEYLNKHRGIDLNAHLTLSEQGYALAIQYLLEEHFFGFLNTIAGNMGRIIGKQPKKLFLAPCRL